jgi:hypothetical protein
VEITQNHQPRQTVKSLSEFGGCGRKGFETELAAAAQLFAVGRGQHIEERLRWRRHLRSEKIALEIFDEEFR